MAQRGIDANGLGQQQALRLAVFRNQGNTGAHGLHGAAPVRCHGLCLLVRVLAGQLDRAAVCLVCAVQQAQQLGATSAHQTRHTQHFASVQLQADVLDHIATAHVFCTQQHGAGLAAGLFIQRFHVAADHALHQRGF